MAVKALQPEYMTSDGTRHASQELAEKHEKLATARDTYEAAKLAVDKAFLDTQLTRDGHPFRVSCGEDYYFIRYDGLSRPYKIRVHFYPGHWYLDEQDEARVVIKPTSPEERECRYPVNDLYWKEDNCEKELVVKLAAWIENQRERCKEMAERLKMRDAVETPADRLIREIFATVSDTKDGVLISPIERAILEYWAEHHVALYRLNSGTRANSK